MNSLIRNRCGWLVFAMSFPTLLTLTYFIWLRTSPAIVQQSVYALGKLIQFGHPLVFVALSTGFTAQHWPKRLASSRERSGQASLEQPSANGLADRWLETGWGNLAIGALFGLLVVTAMLVVYHWLLPEGLVQQLTARIETKLSEMELNSPARFLTLSLFYVVGHSFLEEYYWRWFVFDQLQQIMNPWKANLIAGLGFMAHHVVLLATFFGWDSPFTYVLSISVAVGGIAWAWLFNRTWGFRSAWLSHAIVDAGIFGLGLSILYSILYG